ncbi:MAG: phosphotyrosine protein phosphatase [Epsilonproteobacteria bacterium]|nr:phosphotyrosine protein phosphatase [Campylobacterota bacterium]
MHTKQNLLFICSRNKWRSPTAETIYTKEQSFNVRSAGTSPKARRTVNHKDIRWADIIFVMEKKHKSRLKAQFLEMLNGKKLYVLDIPDEYLYMDEALIYELESKVDIYLDV